MLTPELQTFYNPEGNIPAEALVDMNSGNDERGICACRILVPGMSEIYPIDDLEWENNSDGDLRFFGRVSPGLDLAGCDLHQRLLKEYEKAHASALQGDFLRGAVNG